MREDFESREALLAALEDFYKRDKQNTDRLIETQGKVPINDSLVRLDELVKILGGTIEYFDKTTFNFKKPEAKEVNIDIWGKSEDLLDVKILKSSGITAVIKPLLSGIFFVDFYDSESGEFKIGGNDYAIQELAKQIIRLR